jgi:hypothetical protein
LMFDPRLTGCGGEITGGPVVSKSSPLSREVVRLVPPPVLGSSVVCAHSPLTTKLLIARFFSSAMTMLSGFFLQEEGACVPRALVFSVLLLKKLRFLAFKVNKHIAIIFIAAINSLDAHLFVEWDANQVNAPTTKSTNFTQRLTLVQRNKEIRAGHGRGHNLVYVVFEHLGYSLIFKVAVCHPWD